MTEEEVEAAWAQGDPRPKHVKLSDEKWSEAVKAATAAGALDFKHEHIRKLLDSTSYCSGYFRGFMVWERPDKRDWNASLRECDDLQAAIAKLVPALRTYIGGEGDWDDHDPFEKDRQVEPVLKVLWERIEDRRQYCAMEAERAPPPPPNAKEYPAIERWAAGVLRVWVEFLRLSERDSVHLRRFMVACMPLKNGMADPERRAKHLIGKILRGEIEKAESTLMERLESNPPQGKSFADRVKDNLEKS